MGLFFGQWYIQMPRPYSMVLEFLLRIYLLNRRPLPQLVIPRRVVGVLGCNVPLR